MSTARRCRQCPRILPCRPPEGHLQIPPTSGAHGHTMQMEGREGKEMPGVQARQRGSSASATAAAQGGPEGAGMRGAGSWGAQRVLMQQHESCARAERSPSCPDSPQPCAPCRIQLLHSSFLGSFQVPPTELASSPTQTSMTE